MIAPGFLEFVQDPAGMGSFFRGRVPDHMGGPDAILREVVRMAAERYVLENYEKIAAEIDPKVVAIAVQQQLVDNAVVAVGRIMGGGR